MKTSGLLLSCLGFAGLLVATTLEIGTGSGLLRAINYGFATELMGGLIDHRTASSWFPDSPSSPASFSMASR